MGADKSSEVYQAGISWASGIMGTFPDPLTTQVSITPNLDTTTRNLLLQTSVDN